MLLKKWKINSVILYIFFLHLSYSLCGQSINQVFEINTLQDTFHLRDYAEFWIDVEENIELSDLKQADIKRLSDFSVVPDGDIYWLRLKVKSKLPAPSQWRLFWFTGWVEKVEVYTQKNGQWQVQRTGYLTPVEELDQHDESLEEVKKIPMGTSLQLEPEEEKTIYVRYEHRLRRQIDIEPVMYSMVAAANRHTDYLSKHFYIIVFMGMLWVFSLYNFLIFLMNRDIAYLFYGLYVFVMSFAATLIDRYAWLHYDLFYADMPHIQPWIFISGGLFGIITYSLFSLSFLDMKKRFPVFYILICGLIGVCSIVYLILCGNYYLNGRQYINWLPFSFLVLMTAMFFVLLTFAILRKRTIPDLFYLCGATILLIFIFPEHLFNLLHWHEGWSMYNKLFSPFSGTQIGFIAEILVFSLGLGYRTSIVEKEKQRFEDLNKMKSHFFTNISHEFRTPLTLIIGPIKNLMAKVGNQEDKKILQAMLKNAQRLLALINQLLALSRLEAGQLKLKAQEQDIVPLLKGIVLSFEPLANRHHIHLKFKQVTDNCLIYIDKEKIEKIFYNLLSNAFKFTPDHGRITVVVIEHKTKVEIRLLDSGIGIPAEHLPQIFDRFYQGDASSTRHYEGSGIGLALTKELVELHKGTIKVTSKLNKGTVFTINFKKGKGHLSPAEIETELSINADSLGLIAKDTSLLEVAEPYETEQKISEVSKDAPLILIVEDNLDVRYFIRQHLKDTYQILEAENGQEGIEKALEHIPDLIISDVMMPEKNGYELCETLKNDERTSHIPIIILTAKARQEEKNEGLFVGADDYLIKPFDTAELLIRVKNLIRLRQLLRKQFAQKIDTPPKELVTNKIDETFLEKLSFIVQENLTNEQFNVERFAQLTGMSTAQLNRKLRGLLDQSTNQFIQSTRLQYAANALLQQTDQSIGDIAFSVGFNSTAYFSKCFKKQYGMSPKNYAEEMIEQ